MKKIIIVLPGNLPVPVSKGGAVETLVQMLIDENEKKNLYNFTLFTYYDKVAYEKSLRYKNCKFFFIKKRKVLDKILYLLFRIFRKMHIAIPDNYLRYKSFDYIKKHKNDINYILFEAGEVYSFLCLKKIKNVKLIIHAHWNPPFYLEYNEMFSAYIGVSNFIVNNWMTKTKNNFFVLNNRINSNLFTKRLSALEIERLKNKLNISNEFIAIYTGRMVEEKGVYELISAFDSLEKDKFKLIIIGSSNFGISTNTLYEKKINRLIEKNKEKILFTGYLPNSELYKYYSIANVSVIPSIFDDPAPLVAIEASASAKAIITTGSGGIKEYISSEGAIFVDKNNLINEIYCSIIKLSNNIDLCKRMGEKNFEKFMKNNNESYIDDFSKILEKI